MEEDFNGFVAVGSSLQQQLVTPSPVTTPRKKKRVRQKAFSIGREHKFIRILPKYSRSDGLLMQDSPERLPTIQDTREESSEKTALCVRGAGGRVRGRVPRSYSSVTRIGVEREVDEGSLKRHRSEGETLHGGTMRKNLIVALDSRGRRILYNSYVSSADSNRPSENDITNGRTSSRLTTDVRCSRNGERLRLIGRRIGVCEEDVETGGCGGPGASPYSSRMSSSKASSLHQGLETEGMEGEEEGHAEPTRTRRCIDCCKRFLAFLFSTIGLCCLMVGYTIVGGFIFKSLEAPNEVAIKNDVRQSLSFHVKRLWNVTEEMNVLHPENWTKAAEAILDSFTREVYLATKIKGWDGKSDGERELQWSFPGALLYSVTVITTIGYGHIAPKTSLGQVVTMLYAIFGIPLTLLTITNLGGFMATAFRYIYKSVCRGLCACACCRPPTQPRSRTATNSTVTAVLSNKMASSDKKLSTVSNKMAPDRKVSSYIRSVSQQTTGKLAPYAISGAGARSISQVTGAIEAGKKLQYRRSVSMQTQQPNCMGLLSPQYDVEVKWRSGLHRTLQTDDNKNVSVPIYISLLLIAGYIAIGAVLFSIWEGWDLLVGAYFCFITLSTIGFGDYVPGTSLDAWNSQEKLILCALYLIFGLALLAMCFDLMQEETRRKFRLLGHKLGLLDKKP